VETEQHTTEEYWMHEEIKGEMKDPLPPASIPKDAAMFNLRLFLMGVDDFLSG